MRLFLRNLFLFVASAGCLSASATPRLKVHALICDRGCKNFYLTDEQDPLAPPQRIYWTYEHPDKTACYFYEQNRSCFYVWNYELSSLSWNEEKRVATVHSTLSITDVHDGYPGKLVGTVEQDISFTAKQQRLYYSPTLYDYFGGTLVSNMSLMLISWPENP